MNPFLLDDSVASSTQNPEASLEPPEIQVVSSDRNAEDEEKTKNWNDPPARLSRSPRPYRRKVRAYPDPSAPPEQPTPTLLTPALTPTQSEGSVFGTTRTPSSSQPPTRPPSRLDTISPEESGAEADDETFNADKALPAPPPRLSKGLRHESEADEQHEYVLKDSSLSVLGNGQSSRPPHFPGHVLHTSHQTPSKQATGRLIQRSCEVGCLAVVACLVTAGSQRLLEEPNGKDVPALTWAYIVLLGGIICATMLRRLRYASKDNQLRVDLASKIDPAPVLYPPILPILIVAALRITNKDIIVANIVLGLSTLPRRLISPRSVAKTNTLHWLITLTPILLLRLAQNFGIRFTGEILDKDAEMHATDPSLLFPLHQSLLNLLRYLVTGSLLSSEIQLLSLALVNLLLFAQSPQMVTLKYFLWIGGLGVFYLCRSILRANIALERIPTWRFRRAGTLVRATQTFWGTLSEGLSRPTSKTRDATDKGLKVPGSISNGVSPEVKQAVVREKGKLHRQQLQQSLHDANQEQSSSAKSRAHRRRPSSTVQSYLSMTPTQVKARKWLYAAYTYLIMLLLIFGPIRILMGRDALEGTEPFGWAISYLGGDITAIRDFSQDYPFRTWIPQTPLVVSSETSSLLTFDYKVSPFSRRILFVYWLLIVSVGVTAVLLLSNKIAVDTRRKIFHFTMVGILLPTVYFDPCYLSLGLVMVLVVFLLLEIIRASQLKPLAQPLARFLSPYVDGRDLRGPIVISHIFLLIGCAIPFWLSIEALPMATKEPPWNGWVLAKRDVSLLAGVICVGMGDAAASLVGRAVGRHKWPWPGGKSIEGSAAFACAVTFGMVIGQWWLVAGGWEEMTTSWGTFVAKAGAASCLAAMTEAVLTGCNDNVVVPIVLWLAVRGMRL